MNFMAGNQKVKKTNYIQIFFNMYLSRYTFYGIQIYIMSFYGISPTTPLTSIVKNKKFGKMINSFNIENIILFFLILVTW